MTDVRFSHHYPLIYSVSKDNTMRCWRSENLQTAAIYRGHRYPIWCMDESPVGMYVATGSKDLTARLWSLEREFPLITYAGHTQDVEVRYNKQIFLRSMIKYDFILDSVLLFIPMEITLPRVQLIFQYVCGVLPAAN